MDPDSGEGYRLDALKAEVAEQHLGDASLGPRLKGGNAEQLREDAERLRDEARLPGSGRPSPQAAAWLWKRRCAEQHERLFGRSAP